MDSDDVDDIPDELKAILLYDQKIILGLIRGHSEIVRLARETLAQHHLWLIGEELPNAQRPRVRKSPLRVVDPAV